MTFKTQAIVTLVIALTAFAVGRFSKSTAPAVKTTEDVQNSSDTKINKDTHKVTTITKKPNGEETTTITEDTTSSADRKRDSVAHIDQSVTPPKLTPLNLSVLAGVDPLNSFKAVYGLSVNKQVLGPVTVGVWGYTNSTFGVSLGLNF